MYTMNDQSDGDVINMLVWAAIIGAVVLYFRRRRRCSAAFGSAEFATDKLLKAWGMLAGHGLVLGRTLSGKLIRLPRYCHTLLVGGTGSGKGVGIIIPNLLDYARGSVVVFDTKGDLYETARRRGRKRRRNVRLAPFGDGGDRWNPLDTIPADSPLLIDSAGAMAESLVVRSGTNEPHWDDKAAQIIKAVLVYVLLKLREEERNLNSVQDICSDPKLLSVVGDKLIEMGGIPARCGHHVKGLFDGDGQLTKEGNGVMSTVARHLSFLDSEAVARSVAESTWDVNEILGPDVRLFLQIPTSQLDAQRSLLRCWVSTITRFLGSSGSEETSEVLMLLDEASALGGLAAVEEALVRGRSAGVRMLLAYQSDSQVRTAFKDKPQLLYDNCSVQLYLKVTSIEQAERLSKSLGDFTEEVEGDSDSWGTNWGSSNGQESYGGQRGGSTSRSLKGRNLMRPEEILNLSGDYLIALIGDLPAPLLARKLKWYADPAFSSSAGKARAGPASQMLPGLCLLVLIWALIVALAALIEPNLH